MCLYLHVFVILLFWALQRKCQTKVFISVCLYPHFIKAFMGISELTALQQPLIYIKHYYNFKWIMNIVSDAVECCTCICNYRILKCRLFHRNWQIIIFYGKPNSSTWVYSTFISPKKKESWTFILPLFFCELLCPPTHKKEILPKKKNKNKSFPYLQVEFYIFCF